MKGSIREALDGGAWSLADLAFGFEQHSDEEGRPLHEGRAPFPMRENVPMKMRRCPYADERARRWMNVSALAQFTRHLDDVLTDIACFRGSMGEESPSWSALATVMLDLLVRPSVFMLESGGRVTLPAPIAVGYKLASGYTIPIRELLTEQALGKAPPATVEVLLTLVTERGHLLGGREVCAGPPPMLARATEAMLIPGAPSAKTVPEARVRIAKLSCLQLELGIAWSLFDLATERQVLGDGQHLAPRTQHLRGMLEQRLAELSAEPVLAGEVQLPAELDGDTRQLLRGALDSLHTPGSIGQWLTPQLHTLLAHGDGAIQVPDPEAGRALMVRFASYVESYQRFVRVVHRLEMGIREQLGMGSDAEFRLSNFVLPPPKAFDWLEMIFGHRIRMSPAPDLKMEIRNQHRQLPAVACGG